MFRLNLPDGFLKISNLLYSIKNEHIKSHDYVVFSNLCARYKSESMKCYNSLLTHTETMLNLQPRNFWDFVHKEKCNNGIPNTIHFEGLQRSGSNLVFNLFSFYFNTVYVFQPSNKAIIPFS